MAVEAQYVDITYAYTHIAPAGFRWTFLYRPPKINEWFLGNNGEPLRQKQPPNSKRHILEAIAGEMEKENDEKKKVRVTAEVTIYLDGDPMPIEDAIQLYKDLQKALDDANVNLDDI